METQCRNQETGMEAEAKEEFYLLVWSSQLPSACFLFFMYIPGPLAQDVNTHNGLDLPHQSLIKNIPYKLAFKSV